MFQPDAGEVWAGFPVAAIRAQLPAFERRFTKNDRLNEPAAGAIPLVIEPLVPSVVSAYTLLDVKPLA